MARRKPFADARKPPPTNDVVLPDGTIRTEKVSPIPFKRKMVDPDGNVIWVSLASERVTRGFENNPYGVSVNARKKPPRFLPFNECPWRKGYVKPPPGENGCDGHDGTGTFKLGPNDPACKHLQDIARNRKAVKAEANAKYAAKFDSNKDQTIKALMKVAEGLSGKADAVAAAAAGVVAENAQLGFKRGAGGKQDSK